MKASNIIIAASAALAGALLASPIAAAAPVISPSGAEAVSDIVKQATGIDQAAYRRVYRHRFARPYWRGHRFARCWNCGGWYWRHHRYYGFGYPYYAYGGYPYYGYGYYPYYGWGPGIGLSFRIH
ncbi:MAG: hypothetical protein ACJ8AS_10010 [Hyphomicrobiales bacterium]